MHTHAKHSEGNKIETSGKSLLRAFFINIFIAVIELIGGVISGSLALLSEALHNAGDAISILLSYIAFRFSKKERSPEKTYGYKRIEILAALFNSVLLIVIIGFLFYEAYDRLYNPQPVKSLVMTAFAFIGMLANGLSVIVLKSDADINLNVKSAFIHQLGDSLSSLAVLIGGILIFFFHMHWLDPLLTVLIGLYILKEAVSILIQSSKILMQSTPDSIRVEEIENELKKFPLVINIHNIHVWSLNDTENHFDCHIEVAPNTTVEQTDILRRKINSILKSKFDIQFSVLQIEVQCEA